MTNIALPFPVLGRGDDYVDAEFQVALKTDGLESAGDSLLELPYSFDLSDDAILELIKEGKAKYGFEILCSATAVRYVEFTEQQGYLVLDPRKFFREVILNPRVFVVDEIKNFRSENFNSEFGELQFDFEPGDFLAATERDAINVDFEYLKFEDAAVVRRMPELDPWLYTFGLEGDAIIIGMGNDFHDFWTISKSSNESRPLLIMTVYKDCIAAVLDQISSETVDESLSWVRGFYDLLESKNITLPTKASFDELNKIAQKIIETDGVTRIKI